MGFQSSEWAYRVPGLTAPERAVLVALAHCRNDQTGACYPGQDTLMAMTSLSDSTVRRALAALEKPPIVAIKRTPRFSGRYRTSDSYELLFDNHRSDRPPVSLTGGQTDHRSERRSPPVTVTLTTGHSDHPIEGRTGSRTGRDEQEEISSSFERAYAAWPKKVERTKSRELFEKKAKTRGLERLTEDVIRFGDAYARTTEKQFTPALSAWLNRERWEDELPTQGLPTEQEWQSFLTAPDDKFADTLARGRRLADTPAESVRGRPSRDQENLAVVARLAAADCAAGAHNWLPNGTCMHCDVRPAYEIDEGATAF